MRRVLIPIDDSACCLKAVEYAGGMFAGMSDLEIALVHVMPGLPALFWDDGHILGEQESRERAGWVRDWLERHRGKMEPILKSAAERLVRLGFERDRVGTRFVDDAGGVGPTLLEEARAGGFQTILLGRCGIAEGKHFIVGSVTSKLIHHGAGVAVCVVE